MTATGFIKPVNKIVAAGDPIVQELKVEVAANMYPGRLVKRGTNADDMEVADNAVGNDIIGFLGYEQTAPSMRPGIPTDIYEVDAQAAVLNGGGFVIVATLATTQTITKGEALTSAAGGMVASQTIATDNVVGYAEEDVATAGATATIMVRSVI